VKLSKSPRSMTIASQTISYNSRAVLLALFGLVIFILIVYFASVMIIRPNDIQYLNTVFIGAISGSLALGGTLISQLWGKDDTSFPSIYLTDPPNGKENVPIDTRITATFDRMMNESTINEDTFSLKEKEKKEIEKAEKVHLEGGNAILQPATRLRPSTLYFVTITKDVKDVSGNSLAKDYSWSFKTGP
jgi:hypothetical protein